MRKACSRCVAGRVTIDGSKDNGSDASIDARNRRELSERRHGRALSLGFREGRREDSNCGRRTHCDQRQRPAVAVRVRRVRPKLRSTSHGGTLLSCRPTALSRWRAGGLRCRDEKRKTDLSRTPLSGGSYQRGSSLVLPFQLSGRDIKELLCERGVTVSHESIRRWTDKFGPCFARQVRAARRKLGSTWHFDEMFVTPRGEPYVLWRAVDEHD